MKRLSLLVLGPLLAASVAMATTYVRVEPDGTKTYSDRPLPGGHEIEISAAQTYSAPPPPASAGKGMPLEQQLVSQVDTFRYQSCTMLPDNDATFTNPPSVPIALLLKPQLRIGDIVDLRVDGTSVGGPTTTSYSLQPANRGTHTATAVVKDRFGVTLCNASVSFHVFRPSLNSPARH